MKLVEAWESLPAGRAVLYARVSAHDQRTDLDRQFARLTAWATGQGVGVAEVVSEVGSVVNAGGRRSGGCSPTCRCAYGGGTPPPAGPLRHRASGDGAFGADRRIVVANPGETSNDLVRDMIDVLVSFCARLYGRRGARNLVLRALACTKRAPEAARVGGEDD